MKYTTKKKFLVMSLISALGLGTISAYAADNQSAEIDELKARLEKIEKQSKNNLQGKFKGAVQVTGKEGAKFKMRGRFMSDYWNTSGSELEGGNITGSEIRRARLGIEGQASSDFAYKLEVDFAGSDGSVTFKDAYVQYKGFKDTAISVGLKNSDWSMSAAGSSRFTDMIERPTIVNAFYPVGGSRGSGIVYFTGGKNWHWSAQLAGGSSENAGKTNDNTRMVSRFSYAPILDKDMKVHLGGWGYKEDINNDPDNSQTQIKTRIGNHFNDVVRVKSGKYDASGASAYGLETAAVLGSFAISAEYMTKTYIDAANSDPSYSGYYATASYFLTGESKNYSGKKGSFGRVKPNNPITNGGLGAWQVAARVESTDLNDSNLAGSKSDSVTLGVNWVPTAYTRVMFNYVSYDISGEINDKGNHIGVRFQTDW